VLSCYASAALETSRSIGNFGSNPGMSETEGRTKYPHLRAFSHLLQAKLEIPHWLAGDAVSALDGDKLSLFMLGNRWSRVKVQRVSKYAIERGRVIDSNDLRLTPAGSERIGHSS
jgi:hypothetical protein